MRQELCDFLYNKIFFVAQNCKKIPQITKNHAVIQIASRDEASPKFRNICFRNYQASSLLQSSHVSNLQNKYDDSHKRLTFRNILVHSRVSDLFL